MARRAKSSKGKAQPKRSPVRKPPKGDGARVRDLEKRLAEALEQQTATAEILRVISSSPTDLQPVFDTIVRNAVKLCAAEFGGLQRISGDRMTLDAQCGVSADEMAILQRDVFPLPITRESATGRAVVDRVVVHIHDIREDPQFGMRRLQTMQGFRTILAVPMIREGVPIGALALWRREVHPFTDSEVSLVQSFADQAVIAIENVRLFSELEVRNTDLTEALEQQTATSEILRVISQSPTDVEPVFRALTTSAIRLVRGDYGGIELLQDSVWHLVASEGLDEGLATFQRIFPIPLEKSGLMKAAATTGTPVHTPNVFEDPRVGPFTRELASAARYHALIHVPLLRRDVVMGLLTVLKREPGPFSPNEIALLQTFADQAVIAIENVRLFKELQESNRDLTTALDTQTATSEILRVISRSPTDVQPVFDAIVDSAVRLCDGAWADAYRFDGERQHLVACSNLPPEGRALLQRFYPRAPDPEAVTGRAILDRAVIHVPDAHHDPRFAITRHVSSTVGGASRSVLAVPMLNHGEAVGVILVHRGEQPWPFSSAEIDLLKTFADQAVIAIENVRLFTELQQKNAALTQAHAQVTEALDQQTATAEILRTIAQAQSDAQPVFDTIVRSTARLCKSVMASVLLTDGQMLYLPANYGSSPEALAAVRGRFPRPLNTETVSGIAIRTRSVVVVPDVEDPSVAEFTRQAGRLLGYRSLVTVPMLHEGEVIGALNVCRQEPGRFSGGEIALLQTFADQAVIAIENVRLFKELEGRNRDLTATAEILRVISSSPTDVQPVFDTIVRSAVRLCDGLFSSLYKFDGELIRAAAQHNYTPEALEEVRRIFPTRPLRGLGIGRAILERVVVHIPDTELDPEFRTHSLSRAVGMRSGLFVPMLREGVPIGAIMVSRAEPGPFSDSEIELLKTFADQAVIAIENVRLFTELQEKNEALTQAHAQVSEALDQQTATSEILRVISRSQTDVQPVFDTIVRSAVRLCDGLFSALNRFDGELIHPVARHNYTPEALEEQHRIFPARPTRGLGVGRAILERAVVHIPDVELDPEYQQPALSRAIGFRSGLWVPMLREGTPIGVIGVARAEPGPFSDNEIELLKTFADQAVIAVENVRLFKELQARTGELTQSVEKLTALGEISRAVTSTLDVETVLDTIVSHASQLAGAAGCSVYEYDEGTQQFELRATHHDDLAFVEALRAAPLRKGEGLMGRAAEMREPIQIPDITQPGAYQSSVRDTLIRFGYRALLSVPLLREDQIIGSLSFNRKAPGEFPPEVVEVLKTFATQSALAIQNARLFREIADKSAQLEAASRHKSEFLANMSHELRTPLNAVIGFSEVLSDGMFGEINEKQAEYLRDILESGRHLLSLINDILDLSKIEAGRMELEAADFDLPSAIDNALILVRERATRRGITLGRTIDDRLGMLRGDERKVKQVLLNLLSNALKFTPEGGRIDVGAQMHDGVAEVSVTDTGVGVAPEDQEAIFEEFRQVGTADKKVEGTGLGLALSRRFVELHGGRIWVESTVGKGSTFTFQLPMRHGE